MPMKKNLPVIFEYTDRQAVEDGVLVSVDHGKVNRVTRAVFAHFTEDIGQSPTTGLITNVTALMRVIEAILRTDPDKQGWRTGKYHGRDLWLVPNETGRLTLMFPGDY